jgi:hypothetical protein
MEAPRPAPAVAQPQRAAPVVRQSALFLKSETTNEPLRDFLGDSSNKRKELSSMKLLNAGLGFRHCRCAHFDIGQSATLPTVLFSTNLKFLKGVLGGFAR